MHPKPGSHDNIWIYPKGSVIDTHKDLASRVSSVLFVESEKLKT